MSEIGGGGGSVCECIWVLREGEMEDGREEEGRVVYLQLNSTVRIVRGISADATKKAMVAAIGKRNGINDLML